MGETFASPSRTLDDDDVYEPTQPFSSCGPPSAPRLISDRDELKDDGGSDDGDIEQDGAGEGGNDGDDSAVLDSDTSNRGDSQVDITCRNITVTWEDASSEAKRVEGLALDLYLDAPTNTAIFKLYGYVLLKGSKDKNSKQAIYLFIHPESLVAISLQTVDAAPSSNSTIPGRSRHSLCFSMTAGPRLVVPKNLVLESRAKTRALLDSIQALATVKTFTAHFSNPDTAMSLRDDLELIASVFSLPRGDNRPSTNYQRANLTTLYAGRGGEIVNASNDATNLESHLPPYSEPGPSRSRTSSKRKRENSDTDNERPSTTQDHILLVLKAICTRLDGIENRMGQLEDKVSEALDAGRSPCRYGTEERTEILQEVDNRLDECITDLKVESHDIIEDLKDEVEGTLQRLDDETSERLERLGDDVDDNTARLVEKCVKKRLQNASLRIDGSVFLDV
ncbi:hypothetical protein BBK36DRAFT_1172496 [Trichoderma citrinoviride]|uniref:Uncharacterized protein n=1 Tax=Trichoderma citrinoviride TaxID=58853 RepID=A0A2T4B0I7_9HYPO|nr:hypothetical protein BBK36DRAFT_1172496 [Trichoderma citrinoviride]PTB62741.1 hypothetical protein BBK36DRAFT_1172496 [Trichoderma citrinoviride]